MGLNKSKFFKTKGVFECLCIFNSCIELGPERIYLDKCSGTHFKKLALKALGLFKIVVD